MARRRCRRQRRWCAQAFNPPADFGDDAQLAQGQELYTQNCTICHEGGRGMGGFPDLRTTPMMQSAEVFKAIVIDGALTENGMMSFNKVLSPADAEAIRSHLVRLANDVRDNPRPAGGGFGVRRWWWSSAGRSRTCCARGACRSAGRTAPVRTRQRGPGFHPAA